MFQSHLPKAELGGTMVPVGRIEPPSSWATSDATRRSMQANKGRDTRPELAIRRLLHADGFRYRVNFRPVPGFRRTADIVFTRAKVAVFIDGCFWHGCPEHYQRPLANRDYWDVKVHHNRARDAETNSALADAGWAVLRFWEHEKAEAVVTRIKDQVEVSLAAAVRHQSR